MNPRIVRADGDNRDLEGCLSIPGYVAYVTRREKVWVVAQNRHGKKIKVAGSGLLSRGMQHEIDHLDGRLYIDYLDSLDELISTEQGDDEDEEGLIGSRAHRRRVSDGAAAEPSTVVRAVFFGSGSFAVPILDALVALPGIRVEAVVSAPDRPVGRKAIPTPTPVAARARELALPLLQPIRVRKPEAVDALATVAPDLVVLADYGQLIPRVLLDLPAAWLSEPASVRAAAVARSGADPGHDSGGGHRVGGDAHGRDRGDGCRADRGGGAAGGRGPTTPP